MLPDVVEYVLGGLALLFIGLGLLSRRMPHVAWLQPFDMRRNLTPEQVARIRRRTNAYEGVQLILMGLLAPLGFLALKVMFFDSPSRTEVLMVGAASLLLIGLGIAAIASSRRR